ncbi:MAG TPA: UDP-3-O-(3-hydroxymyristoyl)glucosamine N-acyltransferase, partial [Verrucomicrobia bacterium]|nr:UDP-3-O-(3-hydroxymyristoyl)glucosamine N-acyltransferase [Verrucomicrobiota bacterium]
KRAITIQEILKKTGGRLVGQTNGDIHSTASLDEAKAGQVSFLANSRYSRFLETTNATVVFVKKEYPNSSTAQIVIADPYFAFTQLVIELHGHRPQPHATVSDKSSIAPDATLGKDCHIGDFVTLSNHVKIGDRCILYPNVFIGPNTVLGDDCILYPNVTIYDDCSLGNRVIVQANAVIGEDGFGFATHKGVHHKIPHIGKTVLEDDVEIGSCCGIERGAMENTVIGKGSKIGDLVAIGHGTKIGDGCLVVAQAGVAGSVKMGSYCQIGGQAGIKGHIEIGNGVGIAAKSGVHTGLKDGSIVFGTPAFDIKKAIPSYLAIKSLPEMRRTIKDLERRLSKMEKRKETADQ